MLPSIENTEALQSASRGEEIHVHLSQTDIYSVYEMISLGI